MKLSEMPIGAKRFTQMRSSRVLAVLSRTAVGYRVYIGAVPGLNHDDEWQEVALHGGQQVEAVAKAILVSYFHPSFEIDIPYDR